MRRALLWAAGLMMTACASLPEGPVTWKVPEDGGTPRRASRITPLGDREFRIAACAEEEESPLRHAVSRLDLIAVNPGDRDRTVTLHLDLSGDGKRKKLDHDARGFGGMLKRDYLYVQEPGKPWRRVDGSVDDWTCTVSFTAVPGETRIGLSPWYPFEDYRTYMGSLPRHPHLAKAVAGKSDGGREIWELTITDPSVPAGEKRRIFWHAREHAYECFSSFAMEGLVAFLLSEEAAEIRRRYAITLHPMTNVDGVARGYEYRWSYDFPKPRGTATAAVTWGAIDRLRPDLVITWHNWIAPRDGDVVFYTDDEAGTPTRRAWDLFTQRFPSPRAVGHRWLDETNPIRYNWAGRSLSEDNVHQYAMKRYGSRVWGWEMPWWGRDAGDPLQNARKHGADFARAFFAVQAILAAPPPSAADAAARNAPAGLPYDFVVRARSHVADPRREGALIGELTSPSGARRQIEGVFEGGEAWRLTFTPDEAGEWTYLLRGEGVEHFSTGRLTCTAPR